MTIAIDVLSAKSLHHGVGVYIKNILERIMPQSEKHTMSIIKRPDVFPMLDLNHKKQVEIINIKLPLSARIIWEWIFLPQLLNKKKIDLFWGPTHFLPPIKVCKYVVTIHELVPFVLPRSLPFSRRHYRRLLSYSIRLADVIIVVSESLKQDLIKFFPVQTDKIKVIHNGVDESFQPQSDNEILSRIQKKYQLPSRFILTLGVMEPKKNIIGLIQSYADLRSSFSDLPKLVIGGSRKYGWKNSNVFKLVQSLSLENEIFLTDSISHEDLPAVYSLAELFILPSFYEGFGLPVVEAMACGTPVITSNTSSLPEVAGDAAILVNPYNVADITNAMKEVLLNETKRKQMIERGFQNAKRFSWNRAANELLQVFEEVYKS